LVRFQVAYPQQQQGIGR